MFKVRPMRYLSALVLAVTLLSLTISSSMVQANSPARPLAAPVVKDKPAPAKDDKANKPVLPAGGGVCPTPVPRALAQGERGRLISPAGRDDGMNGYASSPDTFDAWEAFGTNMPQVRGRAASTYWPANSHIYLFGGRNSDAINDYNTFLTTIIEGDPAAGTWAVKNAVFPQRNTSNMEAAVLTPTSGIPAIYILGASAPGNGVTNTMYVYNPTADSLTTIPGDIWPVTDTNGFGVVPGGSAVYNNKWYVFGGIHPAEPGGYSGTWVYDPTAAAGTRWTKLINANLNPGRGFIASAVIDGRIVAVGGGRLNQTITSLSNEATVEMLNPSSGNPTWSKLADLPVGRSTAKAFGWDSGSGYPYAGKLIVAGGYWNQGSRAAYIYDPATNTWAGFANLVNARRNYMAAQGQGVFYAIGGYAQGGTSYRSDAERYPAVNPPPSPTPTYTPVSGGQWQINASLGVPRFRVGSATVGNQVYIIGGLAGPCYDSQQNANERFDLTNNTWTTRANMPTARGAVAVAADGSTIYAAGGIQGPFENGNGILMNTNEAYDSAANSWSSKASLPQVTSGGAGAALNGKFYVIAGDHDVSPYTSNTVYVYNEAANSWSSGATLPTNTAYGTAAVLNGQIYHLGGYNISYTNVISGVYAYDPIANTWATKAPLQVARQAATAFPLNGELWVVGGGYFHTNNDGGFTPITQTQSVEIYNPASNSWRYGPPLNYTRLGLGGGAANSLAVIAAGFDGTTYVGSSETIAFNPPSPSPTVTGTPPTATPTGSPTATPTITPTPCGSGQYFRSLTTGASIVPGTDDIGNHTDDGITTITLPFDYTFYGQTFSSANLGANGNLQFNSLSEAYDNAVLPFADFDYAIMPHWDDMRTDNLTHAGEGIFTSVTGTAPNRIFNIEWRAEYFDGGQAINFELRLYEGQQRMDFIYGDIPESASSATVGIQKDTGSEYDQYDTTGGTISSGDQITYAVAICNSPTATLTAAATATATPTAPATATMTPAAPSVTPTDCPNPFVDINGNVFYTAIHFLYCRGIVNGVDATHYGPAGTASRAQFAKVVVLGFAIPSYTPAAPTFTDVPITYFAYSYIESGYHAAILSGYDQATCTAIGAAFPCYGPNRPITRGQLTKLVVVAGNCPLFTPTSGQTFTDVGPSNVFFAYIESAHAAGVINGYPDNTFRPNNNIRRDEMAQIVYKAILNCPGYMTMTPTPPLPSPTPQVSNTPPANTTVSIGDDTYSPQFITILGGQSITWVNNGMHTHTVTADDNSWDSGPMLAGAVYTHTFNTFGTVGYHCAYHGGAGSGQYGTIDVAAPRKQP